MGGIYIGQSRTKNTRIMNYFLLILSTITFSMVYSQEQYGWSDGTCDYSGIINAKLTNQQQLDAIYSNLWNQNEPGRMALRNKAKDTVLIRMDLMLTECAVFRREITNAEFPKNPIWDSLREFRLTELNRECKLKELAILSIKNPDTLYSDKATPKSAKKWIDLICGSDKKVLKAYSKWLGKEDFDALRKNGWTDAQIVEQAKIDFLRFEWWNIVRLTIPRIENHTMIQQEFEKLLLKVKKDCH